MSSFTRTIQRALRRKKHYTGRGCYLGTSYAADTSLKARLAREARRSAS